MRNVFWDDSNLCVVFDDASVVSVRCCDDGMIQLNLEQTRSGVIESASDASLIVVDWGSQELEHTVWDRQSIAARMQGMRLAFISQNPDIVYLDFVDTHKLCIMISTILEVSSDQYVLYWHFDESESDPLCE